MADPVAAQANWRLRVSKELSTINKWQAEWGFLREESPGNSHDALEKFKSGPQYKTIMGLAQRPEVREAIERSQRQGDTLDSFVHTYLLRTAGRELRLQPKEEFGQPVLTSHQYGWGKSLERFGKLTLHLR